MASKTFQPTPLALETRTALPTTEAAFHPNRTISSEAFGEQLSFLPPPPFSPTRPTRGTLADRALGMLMDGEKIDHPSFKKITQSWRLSAVIFTLRTLGWPIETIKIPSPTAHCPDRMIALYRLSDNCIKQFCSTF